MEKKHQSTIECVKRQLRKKLFAMLSQLSSSDVERRSKNVEDKLHSLQEYINARKVLCYYPLNGEPDLRELMRREAGTKEFFLPVIDEEKKMLIPYPIVGNFDELEEGPCKTKQPRKDISRGIDPGQLDLVLVPGVAFTHDGHRLGRGKGYYDRFLSMLSQNISKIGICFSFQVLETLPIHSRLDQKVDQVVTD